MQVRNYNNDVRRNSLSLYDEVMKDIMLSDSCEDIDEGLDETLIEFDKRLRKEKNYEYIMQVLYLTSRVYRIIKEDPDFKKEDIIEGDFFEEEDEEFENVTYDFALLDICNNFNDFLEKYESEDLDMLFSDCSSFLKLSYIDKKILINKNYNKVKTLLNDCPMLLMDLIDFKNTYDPNDFIDLYYKYYWENQDKEKSKNKTVIVTNEYLNKMKEKNKYNYYYLLKQIIIDYYKFNKYKIYNNEEINNNTNMIIEMIENEFDFLINIIDKQDLLNSILEDYLSYWLLDMKVFDKVDEFYMDEEHKKELSKVLKESEKIKL